MSGHKMRDVNRFRRGGGAGWPGLAWPGLALRCSAVLCLCCAPSLLPGLLCSAPLSLVTGVVCCGSVRCGAGENNGIR